MTEHTTAARALAAGRPPKERKRKEPKRRSTERMGRPPKVTDDVLLQIAALMIEGGSIKQTAKILNIGETAVKRARRKCRDLAAAA